MFSIPPPPCPFCDRGPGTPTNVKHENWQKTISYRCDGCSQVWTVTFPDHERRIYGIAPPQKPS